MGGGCRMAVSKYVMGKECIADRLNHLKDAIRSVDPQWKIVRFRSTVRDGRKKDRNVMQGLKTMGVREWRMAMIKRDGCEQVCDREDVPQKG